MAYRPGVFERLNQTKQQLTQGEIDQGLRYAIKDGLASQTMGMLTSGVFIVGYAVHLGASNQIIGILAAIPFFAQLVQLPSIYLVEKYRVRRTICVLFSALSRIFLLAIAAAALLPSKPAGLAVICLGTALFAIFAAVSACSWNSWMKDLVPTDQLGAYFSRRLFLTTALGAALSLVAAYFIARWPDISPWPDQNAIGYAVLFVAGFIAGLVSIFYLAKMPEPALRLSGDGLRLVEKLREPFANKNFNMLIWFIGSWNFAVNLAAPFFTVYMLTRLGFEMYFVIAMTIVSQVAYLAMLQEWGRYSDLFSNKTVLSVACPMFLASIFAWTFTTFPEKHALTIPLIILIHLLMGVASAGINLAAGNIGLKLAPEGKGAQYLAALSFANAIAAGSAPIIGGSFVDWFKGKELSFVVRWTDEAQESLEIQTLVFGHWDFFFLAAVLIGFYALHRLSLVQEQGEANQTILLDELTLRTRSFIHNFSTVSGLRAAVTFPLNEISGLGRRLKDNGRPPPNANG